MIRESVIGANKKCQTQAAMCSNIIIHAEMQRLWFAFAFSMCICIRSVLVPCCRRRRRCCCDCAQLCIFIIFPAIFTRCNREFILKYFRTEAVRQPPKAHSTRNPKYSVRREGLWAMEGGCERLLRLSPFTQQIRSFTNNL